MEQLLRDPNIEPTPAVIASGLGSANTAYLEFIDGLKPYGITLMDWRYYNDGKSWLSKGEYKWTTPRGANKVQPIFWLSIWDGFFKTAFFFASSSQPELLELPLSPAAKQTIQDAQPMGKTKRFLPVVFDIKNKTQLQDIYILAEYRKNNI